MGSGASKEMNSSSQNGSPGGDDSVGRQLYVSLKMQVDSCKRLGELVPHVYGSADLVGSWDPSKALAMERETTSTWEISFVAPSDHETLDFNFLLKPRHGSSPCIVEEGSRRLLSGGNIMDRDAGSTALFKLADNTSEIVEFPVHVKADRVSPFSLAASWRAYKENLESHGSMVRGIPDVTIDSVPLASSLEGNGPHALELDLEHYEVPTPAIGVDVKHEYAANKAEDPRYIHQIPSLVASLEDGSFQTFSTKEVSTSFLQSLSKDGLLSTHDALSLAASTVSGEVKYVGTDRNFLRSENFQGQYVDRGVGNSPRPLKMENWRDLHEREINLDAAPQDMPKAAGAVAAAAVADRMLGPKEHRQLAVILVW